MMTTDATFSKAERLCGKTAFEKTLKEGESFFLFPFRIVTLRKAALNDSPPVKLGLSVPKRKFKRAVDRNRIKRLIREAFRKHKNEVLYPGLTERGLTCQLLLIYAHSEILDQESIEKRIVLIFKKLTNDLPAV